MGKEFDFWERLVGRIATIDWIFSLLGIRQVAISGVIAAALTVWGLFAGQPWPVLTAVFFFSCAVVLAAINELLRLWDRYYEAHPDKRPARWTHGSRRRLVLALIVAVVSGAGYWTYETYFVRERTLHDYFLSDFDKTAEITEYLPLNIDLTKQNVHIGNMPIEMGIFCNWDANSIFDSYYIPGSNFAQDLIDLIADHNDEYLASQRRSVHVWIAPKGDGHQPISDDLTFSKITYIYHDNVFTDAQKTEMSQRFARAGTTVVFRGQGYLEYRKNGGK
jgi:hypothetical protein